MMTPTHEMVSIMDDLVRAARGLAGEVNVVSERTRRCYLRDVKRLLRDTAVISSVTSHYRLRAAWVWWNRSRLRELLADLDGSLIDGRDAYDQLKYHVDALTVCPGFGAVSSPDGTRGDRQSARSSRLKAAGLSKRHGLGEFPGDWELEFLAAFSDLHDSEFNALVLLGMTGCRPAELAAGLQVTVNPARRALVVLIRGGKVTRLNGQPTRELAFAIDHPIASRLRFLDAAVPYCFRIALDRDRLAYLLAVGNTRDRFSELPRISAVTFRHQFASHLKSAGYSKSQIAQALGHRSDRTQQIYGRACHGGGQRSVLAIRATHPVRGHQERDAALEKLGARHIVCVPKKITEK